MNSKAKYWLINISLLFVTNYCVFSQSFNCLTDDDDDPCCNEIISTDPRIGNGYNSERPSMLNHFNWMNPLIWIYLPDGGYYVPPYAPYDLDNPYFTTYEYMQHINYYQTPPPPPYNPLNQDIQPEYGWELIHKHNGYQIDELNYLNPNNKLGPHYILYNKYTEILRIFAAFKEEFTGFDYVMTELNTFIPQDQPLEPYDYKYSGIFSTQTKIARPLDQYTTTTSVKSGFVNPAGGMWFTADFDVAYDPCGCNNRSSLHVNFYGMNEAQITLSGRLIGTQVPLDGSGHDPLLQGRRFLSDVYTDGNNVTDGSLIYNKIDALVTKYKQVKNSPFEQLCIDLVKSAVTGGISPWLDGFGNDLITDIGRNIIWGADSVNLFGERKKFKTGMKFFSEQANKLLMPWGSPAKIPNIGFIEAEMAINGTLNDVYTPGGLDFKFATPGSKYSNDPNITPDDEYPLYNEPLGIFALLWTPTVLKYRVIIPDGVRERRIVKFKLNTDIHYCFNPVLDIDYDKTSIHYSLVFQEYLNGTPPSGVLVVTKNIEAIEPMLDGVHGKYSTALLS
jgi:hypothetical protein